MPATILIIDQDLDSVQYVRSILEAEGYEVVTTVTGQAGIALAELDHPSLILLEVDLSDINGYEVCRSLRSIPAMAKVPIIIYSGRGEVADKVAGFKAGANDYIVKPAAAAELIVRINAALRSEEPALAYTVAVWGTKGGVGTSTIALNLAVALRMKTRQRVTLMDAAMWGGTLPVMMNLVPKHTIADLLPRLYDLDSELLASVLATHSSGVRVLASEPWSQDGSMVQPSQLERILDWLEGASDYIVIDTTSSLDQVALTLLQRTEPVVVLAPEMTSLRNARLILSIAETWPQKPEKLLLVLNRYPVKGGINLKDIENALAAKIDVQIPNDEPLVTYSINRGIPLVMSHPRSAVAQAFFRLAEMVRVRAEKKRQVAQATTAPLWSR
ncbi:MAG: response regulator [Chloroflexi bacterium]|nr:response regulator [Chloroflexota bacterium]